MTWIMVDVETDGPCPGLYSMVSLGAVVVEEGLSRTFYGKFRPISDEWVPEALKVSGHSRDECLSFPDPADTMRQFREWVSENSTVYGPTVKRPYEKRTAIFVSDNNGFDWQFVNYYFHRFCGDNPFGFSSRNLGDLYKGMVKDVFKNFKHLRKTKHTHHPVDDARGNAEALLHMKSEMGLGIKL
jgi:DNA polymerase III epsilon subunit-like protein